MNEADQAVRNRLKKSLTGNKLTLLVIGGLALVHQACSPLSTPQTTSSEPSQIEVSSPETTEPQPSDSKGSSPVANPDAAPEATTTEETDTAVNETAGSEHYRDGIDLASGAFLLGQSAQSPDDWGLVANRWSRAIQSLQLVPEGNLNYETAQSKISEYQRNLNYAQQQLDTLQNPPDPVALAPRPVVPLGQSSAVGQSQLGNQNVANTPDSYTVPILRRQGGTPVIEVTFNGTQRFSMILDTGASHTLITRQMANQLGIEIIGQTQAATASSNNVLFDIGQVDSIEVANIYRTNVRVSIGDSVAIGLLGQDFYRDYDITLKAHTVEFRRR